jgi:hypothetical protein
MKICSCPKRDRDRLEKDYQGEEQPQGKKFKPSLEFPSIKFESTLTGNGVGVLYYLYSIFNTFNTMFDTMFHSTPTSTLIQFIYLFTYICITNHEKHISKGLL